MLRARLSKSNDRQACATNSVVQGVCAFASIGAKSFAVCLEIHRAGVRAVTEDCPRI